MTQRERQLLGCLKACLAAPSADGSTVESFLGAIGSLLDAPFLTFAVQEIGSRRVLYTTRVEIEPAAAAAIEARATARGIPADSAQIRNMFRVLPLPGGEHRVLLGGVPEEADEALADAVFQELVPPLARAAIAQRQRREGGESTIASLALERLALPVVVTRKSCRMVLKNTAAGRLLAEADGVKEVDGALRLTDPGLDRELRLLVEGALSNGDAAGGGPLSVPRRKPGARPLAVAVTALSPPVRFAQNVREHAMVLLSDPDRRPDGLRESLARSYGLTPSEARVAVAALQGKSLDQLAADLYISCNTAKTHLKNIFLKVGVSRQSEMVAAILNGPVGLLAR